MTFSGSYDAADVTFLLKRIEMAPTEIARKEELIQSGARHYSEMVSAEAAPDPAYMEMFEAAFARNRDRFGRDVAVLAKAISASRNGPVAIASLARAGTPVGVLLLRALRALGREAHHYSISIIRDRGIDAVALDRIVAAHGDAAVVFVDGWTGKGAIAAELRRSVAAYNAARGTQVHDGLAVVADLAGLAALSATDEDYLIPPSILNAVVSGLVSRTILNTEHVGPGDFHACVYYAHLEPHDLSRRFVDEVTPCMLAALSDAPSTHRRPRGPADCEAMVEAAMRRHGLADRNRVKPGIGESTRSLLRRVPERLIVGEPGDPDVRHLVHLARSRGVPVDIEPHMPPPYRAMAIIKTLGEG